MERVKNEDVLNAIRERNEQGITATELMQLFGFSEGAMRQHVLKLRKEGFIKAPEVRVGRGRRARYYASEPVEESQTTANVRIDDPAPEPSKHKPWQNQEGYNDPTATEAIKRMERYGGFMPGGIYKTTNSGELFLVLTTYPDTILGYTLDIIPRAVDTDSEVVWKMGANYAVVHTHRVRSVSFKKLLLSTMSKCPFESFKDILRKSPFNSCKKIEVPVDGAVTQEDYDKLRVELADSKSLHDSMMKDLLDTMAPNHEDLPHSWTEFLAKIQEYKDNSELSADVIEDLKASNRKFQIRLEEAISARDNLTNKWRDLANFLEVDATCLEDVIDAAKKYKELAEAPLEPENLGMIASADFAALQAERDVYKSIVDRVVSYWVS